MSSRPVLTARWTELILLNFPVPISAIEPLVPPGTEPDLHDGQAYISIVGFRFHAVRLFGIPVPGHTRFPEINLRYYVRRTVGSEVRRGVVFVREIVPRRAVAFTANWLYNENYITRPMRSTLNMKGPTLAPHDTIEYAWRTRTYSSSRQLPLGARIPRLRLRDKKWNRLAARVVAPLALPVPNSLEEFFVEHYWGYAAARDGTTREYQVVHDPWQIAPADNVTWDCDLSDYSPPRPRGGVTPLAEYLKQPPSSAIIAAGSPIQVHRGHRI